MKLYTLEEVMEVLKIDKQTLMGLIENAELPAIRIHNDYRISQNVLNEFINQKTTFTNESLPPSYYLLSGGILESVKVKSKSGLIQKMVEAAYLHNDILMQDKSEFKNLIEARENMSSTGIGNGIALLHTKSIYRKIRRPFIMLARLENPLDFNSIDDLPIELAFLIAMTNHKSHLRIMGMLAKIFHKNKEFADKLKQANRNQIFNLFIEQEDRILGI